MSDSGSPQDKPGGFLGAIEWIGNKLPDPAALFVLGALLVMVLSAIASFGGGSGDPLWVVEPKQVVQELDEATGEMVKRVIDTPADDTLKAINLLSADGLEWCSRQLVNNFINFAPLGIVLVGMLGIGVAERTGMLGASLKAFMAVVPASMLTPTMVFLGIMSSLGIDAGYVVLPPLAAALYRAVGRSPLVGIAAVFAGVSAGFNANLLVTGLDPMLASFTNIGAQVIDPNYTVVAPANWKFMVISTFLITLVGWGVTSLIVEPRFKTKAAEDGGPTSVTAEELEEQRLKPDEKRALGIASFSCLATLAVIVACILVPGAPLHDYSATHPVTKATVYGDLWGGEAADAPANAIERTDGSMLVPNGSPFAKWVTPNTPTTLIFVLFVIPGFVYGIVQGTVKSTKDAAKLMVDSIAAMAPIVVLAFFAGQFVAYMDHSNLGRMLAYTGGEFLAESNMSAMTLVITFVLLTMVFNLFVGSMSAKYAIFAPIFVPMLMFAGISPELTQAAYRIGDSTTNIITPLNAYLVIILVFVQKYAPRSGMGTLISMMLPYTVVFTIAWLILLMMFMAFGWNLGFGEIGPLEYTPPVAEVTP